MERSIILVKLILIPKFQIENFHHAFDAKHKKCPKCRP